MKHFFPGLQYDIMSPILVAYLCISIHCRMNLCMYEFILQFIHFPLTFIYFLLYTYAHTKKNAANSYFIDYFVFSMRRYEKIKRNLFRDIMKLDSTKIFVIFNNIFYLPKT